MKRIGTRCGIMATAVCLALASCDKADAPTADTPADAPDPAAPFTEELAVPKGHCEVGESGRVYTTDDLLYSKVHAQVMLTKCTGRNAAAFSLAESDTGYVMTVRRMKVADRR